MRAQKFSGSSSGHCLQSPGIDYNSLLNKCSANYSNVNSVRAALSRALKDFSIYWRLRKQFK